MKRGGGSRDTSLAGPRYGASSVSFLIQAYLLRKPADDPPRAKMFFGPAALGTVRKCGGDLLQGACRPGATAAVHSMG